MLQPQVLLSVSNACSSGAVAGLLLLAPQCLTGRGGDKPPHEHRLPRQVLVASPPQLMLAESRVLYFYVRVCALT